MKHIKSDPMFPPEVLTGLAISGLKYAFFIASIKMDVFKKIKGKMVTINQFSKILKIPLSSTRAMTQNLSNMDLLKFEDGKIFNSDLSEEYLTDDEITKKLMIWLSAYSPTPEKLISIIRNPPPQPWYSIKEQKQSLFDRFRKKHMNASFYTEPHDLRIRWGKELADKYDFSKHTRLLDLGGACGGWTVGVLEKFPKLEAMIFERPEVVKFTDTMLHTHRNVRKRIKVISGDFFMDILPGSCDVVLIANILHDWSIKECQMILQNVIASVNSGTAILINEFYFDYNWRNSNYGALQAMLVLGPEGKSGWQPSYHEMENLLKNMGFHGIEKKYNLVIAYKR